MTTTITIQQIEKNIKFFESRKKESIQIPEIKQYYEELIEVSELAIEALKLRQANANQPIYFSGVDTISENKTSGSK